MVTLLLLLSWTLIASPSLSLSTATCSWPARRGGRAQRGAQSTWAGQPGPGLTQAEDRGTEDSAGQY